MKSRKAKIILCIYILVTTLIITAYGVFKGAGQGQLGRGMHGLGWFKAFTNLSNVFMGVCSGIYLSKLLKKKDIPSSVYALMLTGCTGVMVTLTVVVFFLGPTQVMMGRSYFGMFTGEMLFFHLLNPLAAFACTSLVPDEHAFSMKDRLLAILPAFIYSVIYLVCVVFIGCWPDFYGFTFGGHYELSPVAMIAMYALSFALASLAARLHKTVST